MMPFLEASNTIARRTLTVLALLAFPTWIAACGGGDAPGGGEGDPLTATAEFLGLGGSGVTGQADFSRAGGVITVDLLVENVSETGDHPSHVHEGTCREPGGVVVPLNPASVSEPGIVEAESQVDLSALTPGTSYVVMIHSQQGAPIGCAELPAELVQR